MSRHTWGSQVGKDVLDLQKHLENFPALPVLFSVWGLITSKLIYNSVITNYQIHLVSPSPALLRCWCNESRGKQTDKHVRSILESSFLTRFPVSTMRYNTQWVWTKSAVELLSQTSAVLPMGNPWTSFSFSQSFLLSTEKEQCQFFATGGFSSGHSKMKDIYCFLLCLNLP